ncbi:hypothetical protein ACFYMW_40485 [Streptomyces sp. NPDC006692]|uniref:hypothetical protein n=1 Tax=Streptomyces sp. NPDC006692 TaxID=3364758 RepID=UPI003685DF33
MHRVCENLDTVMHAVRTCVVHTFKHAMEDDIVPPIGSIATRSFGPALVSGETWG